MKRNFKCLFTAFCLLAPLLIGGVTSCSSDNYDDSAIRSQLSDLEERISILENFVAQSNEDISKMKILINNLENKIYVQNYVATEDGYRIIFTDGSSIDVRNGKDGSDGKDGKDGQDGQDGKDGATPVVGVSKEADGRYYWTITLNGQTSYLLDDEGHKLPVTGNAGTDGKDGINGKDGNDGTDGADGADGKDGITPQLRIDAEGYWTVSYDNGNSFVYVLDTNGGKVSALGEKGEPGEGGNTSSYIKTTFQYDNYVVFVLYNGTEIKMPIYKGFGITLSAKELQFKDDGGTVTVSYSVAGSDNYTFVETIDKGNVRSKVNAASVSQGTIQINKTGELDQETKVLVLLCNRDQTITTVINIAAEVDTRIDDVVPEYIQDKIEEYIPIYKGVNPPSVEGAYRIEPFECLYCEDYGDGGYAPGTIVVPQDIRFYNQNQKDNTIGYEGYEGDSYESAPSGAFISGSGNYFTIFFNTTGVSYGINVKTALVISGEKTAGGIKDLKYAFIMVEKGSDPNNKLMKEGVFRIFLDGDYLAENYPWTHSYTASKKRKSGSKQGGWVYSPFTNSLSGKTIPFAYKSGKR